MEVEAEILHGGVTHLWRNKNETIYNYCGLMIKSGGITCLKFHLSHMDPHSNTKKCPAGSKTRNEEAFRIEKYNKSKKRRRYERNLS